MGKLSVNSDGVAVGSPYEFPVSHVLSTPIQDGMHK